MARIISIHEYVLKPGVDEAEFEKAFQQAERQGLFQLPGLTEYHLVKGIRGRRQGKYAGIWVYESKEAWERLWGAVEEPKEKNEYPPKWRIWEDEILSLYLDRDPDQIDFTSYQESIGGIALATPK